MRSRLKLILAALFLCFLAIGLLLFLLLRAGHPLPFNPDAFVSTSRIVTLPAKPNLAQRVEHLLLVTEDHLFDHRPRAVSMGAQPASKWGVQPLLNLCTGYSSTQYLIPKDLAAGTVSFGTTNPMDGPQFIAAIENTVCHSNVAWLDSSKGQRTEPLALLRFPEQNAIVVLPKSDVADFLRTNKLDPHRFEETPAPPTSSTASSPKIPPPISPPAPTRTNGP